MLAVRHAASIVCVVVTCQVHAQPNTYAVFDLGDLGQPVLAARAVNQGGVAVGGSRYERGNASMHAFLWRGTTITDLGVLNPDGFNSHAFAINDQDEVVGRSDGFGFTAAVRWNIDGTITDLGRIDGNWSEAFGINNLGQAVGASSFQPGTSLPEHAALFNDGTVVDLGTLETGETSFALDINDGGVVVGWSRISAPTGPAHAFAWFNGSMVDLGLLTGDTSLAEAINELNVIAGWGEDNIYTTAVIWTAGVISNIQTHPLAITSASRDINNLGEVVGAMATWTSVHAFRYRDGEMLLLDDMIPPNSNWALHSAESITDNGLIVGNGAHGQHEERGFMLVPVTPAMLMAPPTPGRAGMVNELSVSGAKPGNRVYFVYGTEGGGARIGPCDIVGAAGQIRRPKTGGSAVADGSGTATLSAFVPSAAANLGDILIQAVDPATCTQSQLVVEAFE